MCPTKNKFTLLVMCFITITSSSVLAESISPRLWRPWMEETSNIKIATNLQQTLLVEATSDNTSMPWADYWNKQNPADIWNNLTLQLILKYRVNPLRASRAFTYVNIVQHDALALALRHSLNQPGQQAAVHLAASTMLAHLFPLETPGKIAAMGATAQAANELRYPQFLTEISNGQAIAKQVTALAIKRAQGDRSDEVWDARIRPKPTPGMWEGAPPLESAQPQEPWAGQWRTWVLKNGAEIQPPPPPALDSAILEKNTREVYEVFTRLTPEQKKIASDWHLDQGSATPPGVWNLKARSLADESGMSNEIRIQMYTALNVAMMDAAIACWHAKYNWWTARPISRIRNQINPAFLPYLVTPPHPSYVSGHASVSGAASEILKKFFPLDQQEIDQWAEEAAMSRLYGGIHYRHDNEEGLALGRKIGLRVLDRI